MAAKIDSKKNKNQTAIERAQEKEVVGKRPSRHTCAAAACPRQGQLILIGELQPVTVISPKKHTVFYHKQCYGK